MALTKNTSRYIIRILSFVIIISFIVEFGHAVTIAVEQGESIQSAIDKASADDIIEIKSGNYKENIIVNKRLILQGVDSDNARSVIINAFDHNKDLITLNADGCIVRRLVINSSKSNSINILSNSNIVSDNVITGNKVCINLEKANLNSLSNNTINIKGYLTSGLLLKDSIGNIIQNNEIIIKGITGDGIELINSLDNVIIDNMIIGKVWIGGTGITIYHSDNNHIYYNRIRTAGLWGSCIYIKKSANNSVYDNNIEHCDFSGSGLTLYMAYNTSIMDNKAKGNGKLNCASIFLRHSENNNISDNEVIGTGRYGSGICLIYSDNNRLDNNAASNSTYGIYLYGSDSNIINENIAKYNSEGDIYLDFYSPRNQIIGNKGDITIVFPRHNIIKDNIGQIRTMYENPMPDDLPLFTLSDIADLFILIFGF